MPKPQPLSLYVITVGTVDYGPLYVVRQWDIIDQGRLAVHTQPHAVTETLEAARRSVPRGSVPLGRNPGDDPVIVETWI